MKYNNRKKSPKKRIYLLVTLLSFSITYIVLIFYGKLKTNPAEAFSAGVQLAKNGSLREAESMFVISQSNPHIRPWALLELAKLEELKDNKEEALSLYLAVDSNSAATLDAEVSKLRLASFASEALLNRLALPNPLLPYLLELQQRAVFSNRKDLLPTIWLMKSDEAMRQGEPRMALNFYNEIRESFPKSEEAKLARERSPNQLTANEIRLLIKEEQFDLALKLIDQITQKELPHTSTLLQALLQKEEIFRKTKRNIEADSLLRTLAEEMIDGVADLSLFKLAKGSWNVNDHHQALEYLDAIFHRFPKSSIIAEARYTEARILEEMGLTVEAKESYQRLISSNRDLTKAYKRIAWIYRTNSDFEKAKEYFKRMFSSCKTEYEDAPEQLKGRVADECAHALYWSKEAEQLPTINFDADELDYLVKFDRKGYYLFLAGKLDRVFNQKNLPECVQDQQLAVEDRLKDLISAELKTRSVKEIDYYFSSKPMLESIIPRYFYYQRYGTTKSSIELAESISTENIRENLNCSLPISSRYPTVHEQIFAENAKKNNLNPALLYGLARTESYFFEEAISSVGALGLMQLMPATAKSEGWNGIESLFNPQLNISLGSKHLKRLINSYPTSTFSTKSQTESGGTEEIDRLNEAYAIAAYNSGGAAVNRWRSRYPNLAPALWVELIPYPETYRYVKDVIVARAIYEHHSH
jgi:tetratricopeptide (TPR) repeat protein